VADLAAAERIAAEAIWRGVEERLGSAPRPFHTEAVRNGLRSEVELDAANAVTALSAAGWLVEPVATDAVARAERVRQELIDSGWCKGGPPVSPAAPGTAPPAARPP
jgi:hypothetical protein